MEILKIIVILLEVLLFFNLMIVVHELGHFLAARWRGLVVERFGIWFGKPLWQKRINGVWYSLGSIPAGGFVALPQLAPMEAIEGHSDLDRAKLPPVAPIDKIIVAIAGPLFSFGLAVIFAVAVWWLGRPVSEAEATTTIGYVLPDSPAEKAGLRAGDRLVSIDGKAVTRWGGISSDSVTWRIVRSEHDTVQVGYVRDGVTNETVASPVIPARRFWQRQATRQLQMMPAETPMVAAVEPGSAAEKAGLRPNDLITQVNGVRLFSPLGITEYARKNPDQSLNLSVQRGSESVQVTLEPKGVPVSAVMPGSPAEAAGIRRGDRVVAINGTSYRVAEEFSQQVQKSGGKELVFTLSRDQEKIDVRVQPAIPVDDTVPRIGVMWGSDTGIIYDEFGRFEVIHPGPVEQIRLAMMAIVNTFEALLSKKSDIKLQHMSGPVQIVRVYYILFENVDGWRQAIWFSVILNVNLALLNLMPVPVLDGGHIVLAMLEGIRRRPLNGRVLAYIQYTFASLIIGFMLYVTFFDAQDWLGGGSNGPQMRFEAKPADK
ncbi:MAG: site-2 protease family protein [Verrucomicrobiales bacterium]|nr:site-2 protease family protein [Verrucomicrobiales bacterium]